jgi:hypothetical protein
MSKLFKITVGWILASILLGVAWAEQVNPVDFMQDVVIEEGTRQPVKTEADKQKAFRKMLVEQVFLKGFYSSEPSIYKPEPEDGETAAPAMSMSKGIGSIYGTYMRKQLAAQMADEGFLENEVNNAARQAKR